MKILRKKGFTQKIIHELYARTVILKNTRKQKAIGTENASVHSCIGVKPTVIMVTVIFAPHTNEYC